MPESPSTLLGSVATAASRQSVSQLNIVTCFEYLALQQPSIFCCFVLLTPQIYFFSCSEEHYCRFCKTRLPDWREAHSELPKAPPIMTVVHNGVTHQVTVEPGPNGKERFQAEIRKIFNLGESDAIQLTFGCRVPGTGEHDEFNDFVCFYTKLTVFIPYMLLTFLSRFPIPLKPLQGTKSHWRVGRHSMPQCTVQRYLQDRECRRIEIKTIRRNQGQSARHQVRRRVVAFYEGSFLGQARNRAIRITLYVFFIELLNI